MGDLRLPIPRYQFIYIDEKSRKLSGFLAPYFHEVYFYLFRKFNVTYVPMIVSLADLIKSNGVELNNLLKSGKADINVIYSHQFTAYSNLTIGPVVDIVNCKITSFPKIKNFVEVKTALQPFSVVDPKLFFSSILLMIFLIFCATTIIKSDFLMTLWFYITALAHQLYRPPKRNSMRILWFSSFLATTLVQILAVSLIQTDRVQLNDFRTVDSETDVINEKLLALFREDSLCYQRITAQKIFADYLCSKRFHLQKSDYSSFSTIGTLVKRSRNDSELLNSVAILWDNEYELAERRSICRVNPQFLELHPMYSSPTISYFYNPITLSIFLDKSLREKIFTAASVVLENGFYNRRHFPQQIYRARSSVNIHCMTKRLQRQHEQPQSLSFIYFKSTFLSLTFTYFMGTLVLIFELLIVRTRNQGKIIVINVRPWTAP